MARRLGVALGIMLLPTVALGTVGAVNLHSSIESLQELSVEGQHETETIKTLENLLEAADDAGERYLEDGHARSLTEFEGLSVQVEHVFEQMQTFKDARERLQATKARDAWKEANDAFWTAVRSPTGDPEADLDPFHDLTDEAGVLVSDGYRTLSLELGRDLADLRMEEQDQLVTVAATLALSLILALSFARRIRLSIKRQLQALEIGAQRIGANDLSFRLELNDDDELSHLANAFNQMAEKLQEGREALHLQALQDPLTELANRRLFIERLEQAVARARRRGEAFSVLYLDLDGFKSVNDTFGHDVGDMLLIEVANRVRSQLRDEDTLARLGGDEFGVLLEGADATGAARVAGRVRRAFGRPWGTQLGHNPITTSIGIALGSGGEGVDELLRNADTATYAAKSSGAGQCRLYDAIMSDPFEGPERNDLLDAIDNEQLVLHYQPIVDLGTGEIQGVEALVRWAHPERGLLAPAEFLPEAEESGDILHIDRWVLAEACRQVRRWQAEVPGAEDLVAFVNLSAQQLQYPGLAKEVAMVLQNSGLGPEGLTIEITETMLLHDTAMASDELTQIKGMGVQIALDDFGTGYSSLSHLFLLPIDIVKIDRSFIAALDQDDSRSDVVTAIISLTNSLKLHAIAEGIEVRSQWDRMMSLGCEMGQGYFFSRPLEPSELRALLIEQGRTSGTLRIVVTSDV